MTRQDLCGSKSKTDPTVQLALCLRLPMAEDLLIDRTRLIKREVVFELRTYRHWYAILNGRLKANALGRNDRFLG